IADGRQFLEKGDLYDAVIVSYQDQNSISGNRFFTEEFFEKVSLKINKGGVFAIRVKSPENFQSLLLINKNGATLKPFFKVFQNALLLPYSNILGVGANGKIDTELIFDRFQKRKLETKLVSENYIKYLLENPRRKNIEDKISNGNWEKNSDIKPSAYFLSLALEVSRYFPRLASEVFLLERMRKIALAVVIISIISILFLRFFSKVKRSSLTVFVAGFWGMTAEISILIYHQMKNGILYKDIGILTSLFMAGLALGASFFQKELKSIHRILFVICIIVFSALGLFLVEFNISKTFIFLMMFFAGFISGSLFKIAEGISSAKGENLLRGLYFADLFGGALAAVFSTLLLIPLFGIKSSFFAMAVLASLCL
ncbi:MAG: hypothetical protein N2445_02455, partial [Acidobacteria bacterium]|nr:hypothetical protein [Acidobacteriota bacterium]